MGRLVPYEVSRVETRLGPTDVALVGGRDRPVVVLLNGLMGGALSWEWQLAPLGVHFRVVVPELAGPTLRESPAPPEPTPKEEGLWVADVLDRVGTAKASLVALWRGARIAIRFAADAPSRVARLALVSPAGVLSGPMAMVERFPVFRRGRVSARLPIPRRDLRRVTAPAMVLVGEQEERRGQAGALARRWRVLPNLVVTSIMPEAGRALHRDQPGATNALLVDFLLNGADWRRDGMAQAHGPWERRVVEGA